MNNETIPSLDEEHVERTEGTTEASTKESLDTPWVKATASINPELPALTR